MAEAMKGNMTPTEKMQKQYDRLIAARNYHYDNLNKWLMSFYAIIAALFVALYHLHDPKLSNLHMELCITIVGYIVSIGALLSGKGYYYWEYVWIEKLYRFEKEVLKDKNKDMQVYSALANKNKHDNPYCPIDSANISTTKTALLITTCIIVAWGFLISMLGVFKMEFNPYSVFISLGASIVVSYILILGGAKLTPSHLASLDILEDKEKDKNMNTPCNKKTLGTIIAIFIATLVLSIAYGYSKGTELPHESDASQFLPDSTATISAIAPSDSIMSTEEPKDVAHKKFLNPFWESALASAVGSFAVIFILFWLVRPRIAIDDRYKIRDNGTLTFIFRNKSIFNVVNVNVRIKAVFEEGEDETEGNIYLEDNYVACMRSCFRKDNDNVIGVHTKNALTPIPKHLRVIVSAQHSVSGITAVATRDIYTR